MKLIHKKFNYEDCLPEVVALQAQVPIFFIENSAILDKNDEIAQKIRNKNIPLYEKTNESVLCLWFDTIDTTINVLKDNFKDCLFHRKNILKLEYRSNKELIDSLFKEYCAWLNYLKINNINQYDDFSPELLLKFLLVYNYKMFLISKITKKITKVYLEINPFIGYWVLSNALRKALQLPVETLFLPNLPMNEIQELKNLKSI